VLTARETQVLELIAHGLSDREVAGCLQVALSTARRHRENLQYKLGLHKAAQLAIYYLERAPRQQAHLAVPLSPRERQLVHLLALGRSDKQAARELGISDLTVRKQRSRLQAKLGAGNVCALLCAAVAAGCLALPPAPPRPVPPRLPAALAERGGRPPLERLRLDRILAAIGKE